MDSLTPFEPSWGTMEEWNLAFDKVEDYLRACQVPSRLHRARLICGILRRVNAQGSRQEPPLPALAIAEARRTMRKWFEQLVTDNAPAQNIRTVADEMVALYLSDAIWQWPTAFLEEGPPPEGMRKAVETAMLRAGPKLEVSSMVPRPLDFGLLPQIASMTMVTLEKWPALKVLIAWLLFLTTLAYLFWYTRGG